MRSVESDTDSFFGISRIVHLKYTELQLTLKLVLTGALPAFSSQPTPLCQYFLLLLFTLVILFRGTTCEEVQLMI